MDLHETIERIASACGWEYRQEGDCFLVTVPTGGGRGQNVAVVEATDPADLRIARFWTVIGDADRVDHRKCLEENARLPYGAFVIQGKKLCLMETEILTEADPAHVGTLIGNIASFADRFEKEYFGVD